MSANKIILQNIRSIYKNLNEFELLMKQQESQLLAICLTETWLKDQSNTKCINLDGYQETATSNRNTSKGGGVGIFVRMDLKQTIFNSRTAIAGAIIGLLLFFFISSSLFLLRPYDVTATFCSFVHAISTELHAWRYFSLLVQRVFFVHSRD